MAGRLSAIFPSFNLTILSTNTLSAFSNENYYKLKCLDRNLTKAFSPLP